MNRDQVEWVAVWGGGVLSCLLFWAAIVAGLGQIVTAKDAAIGSCIASADGAPGRVAECWLLPAIR